MHFDSGSTGTEFRRNLLVKHPGNDEAHHFAFPGRLSKPTSEMSVQFASLAHHRLPQRVAPRDMQH